MLSICFFLYIPYYRAISFPEFDILRPSLLRLSFLTLLLPGFTVAYYASPSELLRSIEFDGTPRNFSTQIHTRVEDVYTSAWVNGSAEGRTPETLKAKFNATVDMHESGVTMRSRFEATIYNEVVYLRLKSFEGDSVFDISSPEANSLIGKWIAVPIDPASLSDTHDYAEAIAMVQEMTGDDSMTVEDLNEIGKNILDSMLTMEKKQFTGGYAFSIKLRPDFLVSLMATMSSVFPDFPVAQDDLQAMAAQSLVNEMVNLHIKVDTNSAGEFLYAKFYLSINPPDDSMTMVMEGKTVAQDTPVYIDVPKEHLSLEELASLLSAIDPTMPMLTPNTWEEDDWGTASEPTTRVRRTTRGGSRAISPRVPARRSYTTTTSWDPRCSSANSVQYTFLMRKGLCPAEWDTRPGRGSLRSLR